MAAVDVVNVSMIEAGRLLRTKQVSPVELTQAYFS